MTVQPLRATDPSVNTDPSAVNQHQPEEVAA
jgi:hypothetical protein